MGSRDSIKACRPIARHYAVFSRLKAKGLGLSQVDSGEIRYFVFLLYSTFCTNYIAGEHCTLQWPVWSTPEKVPNAFSFAKDVRMMGDCHTRGL